MSLLRIVLGPSNVNNAKVQHISGGWQSSAKIDYKGQAWGWGYNYLGGLGINSTIAAESTPVAIYGNHKFNTVEIGFFSVGIDSQHKAWGWGYNNSGQLGNNSTITESTPIAVYGSKSFIFIKNGNASTVAIDNHYKAWCWGANLYGVLGNNLSPTPESTPVAVLGNHVFKKISLCYYHCVGINQNGRIWSWGYNQYGQLGTNSTICYSTPVVVGGSLKTFCEISTGTYHTLAIDNHGIAWSWGYGGQGALGINSLSDKCTPVAVYGNHTFCKIMANSWWHSAAIDNHGQLWTWGDNSYGQLGINDNTVAIKCTPIAVLGDHTFCSISSGNYHILAIDNHNNAWGWGYNYIGSVGDNTNLDKSIPVAVCATQQNLGKKVEFRIPSLNSIFLIACNFIISASQKFNLAVKPDGSNFSWGINDKGQLGINSLSNSCEPTAILGTTKTFSNIGTGYQHSLALDIRGKAYSWGVNTYGQLGINNISQRNTPVAILGTNRTFCKITGGSGHSLAIDFRGQIWAWGYNNAGQLGNNSNTSSRTPVPVLGVTKTFCNIASGRGSSRAIDFRGKIWSWGENASGQLGDYSIASKATPVALKGVNKTFCKITGGSLYTLALDYRGQGWGWGYNGGGQLGDNTITQRSTPVAVQGTRKTFCQISSWSQFTAALDLRGQAWSWGLNGYGQLGNNTSVASETTPIEVYGSKTFCQIFAGSTHCIAIDYNNKLWGWGYNYTGSIGDGTTNSTSIPVAICNF